jgi:hypothetical protein
MGSDDMSNSCVCFVLLRDTGMHEGSNVIVPIISSDKNLSCRDLVVPAGRYLFSASQLTHMSKKCIRLAALLAHLGMHEYTAGFESVRGFFVFWHCNVLHRARLDLLCVWMTDVDASVGECVMTFTGRGDI